MVPALQIDRVMRCPGGLTMTALTTACLLLCSCTVEHAAGDAGPGDGGPTDGGPVDDTPYHVWPNPASSANSDPWIARHHDDLTEMHPRFLVINFANGVGESGNDQLAPGTTPTEADIRARADAFLTALREASRYQPRLHPDAPPFLQPEIARVVDLHDENGHANSDLFPRGQLLPDTPGYRTVGYYDLFSQEYAPHWGYQEDGRFLTLGEIVDRGYVNEVIMMANQVDGRDPNPPGQVTAHILEVAFVAQAYTADFHKLPDEFVKNGIPYDRQKADMAQATSADDNSMPWAGRSLRIYFLNYSRGAGCLLHSLGHEFEFRYNESRVYSPGQPYDGQSPHPWMQPLFRRFAGFDLQARYGAPFDSLYAGGDDYSYGDCNGAGVCSSLNYPAGSGYPAGEIADYQPGCGNVHYPPGAAHGYDYEPATAVRSTCESFQKPAETAAALSFHNWDYVTDDPAIDGDCGGKFLVYWYQNMPGLDNDALDPSGAPMKNWWPFLYY